MIQQNYFPIYLAKSLDTWAKSFCREVHFNKNRKDFVLIIYEKLDFSEIS